MGVAASMTAFRPARSDTNSIDIKRYVCNFVTGGEFFLAFGSSFPLSR
jgi:hypothetical protein